MSPAVRAAFFDVDDTLITLKSIFRFLEFHIGQDEPERWRYERTRGRMEERTSRSESLAMYFEFLAGYDYETLAAAGRRWFAEEMARGGVFNEAVLARLREHATAGDLIVLVSGSFPACLDPIAGHVAADVLLCSRPEVRAGRYTGAITTPMVGQAKVTAVRAEAAVRGIDLRCSSAYGDHPSDLLLLELVGAPVVVGANPVLAAVAAERGWRRLPTNEDAGV